MSPVVTETYFQHTQAFVAEYEKFPMFHSGEGRRRVANLDEFDDSREEIASLSAAYKDFESGGGSEP